MKYKLLYLKQDRNRGENSGVKTAKKKLRFRYCEVTVWKPQSYSVKKANFSENAKSRWVFILVNKRAVTQR